SLQKWIDQAGLKYDDFLFPSRIHTSPHITTRQYARIVKSWVTDIGLDPTSFGTHSMRRTKASLIYKRTKNLRAVQLLLGHTKLDSTVRYLGIDVDDALEIAEQESPAGRRLLPRRQAASDRHSPAASRPACCRCACRRTAAWRRLPPPARSSRADA